MRSEKLNRKIYIGIFSGVLSLITMFGIIFGCFFIDGPGVNESKSKWIKEDWSTKFPIILMEETPKHLIKKDVADPRVMITNKGIDINGFLLKDFEIEIEQKVCCYNIADKTVIVSTYIWVIINDRHNLQKSLSNTSSIKEAMNVKNDQLQHAKEVSNKLLEIEDKE